MAAQVGDRNESQIGCGRRRTPGSRAGGQGWFAVICVPCQAPETVAPAAQAKSPSTSPGRSSPCGLIEKDGTPGVEIRNRPRRFRPRAVSAGVSTSPEMIQTSPLTTARAGVFSRHGHRAAGQPRVGVRIVEPDVRMLDGKPVVVAAEAEEPPLHGPQAGALVARCGRWRDRRPHAVLGVVNKRSGRLLVVAECRRRRRSLPRARLHAELFLALPADPADVQPGGQRQRDGLAALRNCRRARNRRLIRSSPQTARRQPLTRQATHRDSPQIRPCS